MREVRGPGEQSSQSPTDRSKVALFPGGGGRVVVISAMGRDTGLQILVVGAVTALALAANHFFFHWVLFTEALMRRLIY